MGNKVRVFRSTAEGSVLVFSLIILSLMLVTSLTVLSAAVLQQKAALSTGNSTRSFQVADSGIELVLYQIYKGGRLTVQEIANNISGATCSGGDITSVDGWTVNFFQGENGDVAITDCATDRMLVTRVKSRGKTSSTTRAVEVKVKPLEMLGWWKFDDGSGSTVLDSSGNGNILTWSGSSGYWSSGKFGQAGNFNGTDNFAARTSSITMPTNVFTLAAWVRIGSVSVDKYIMAVGRDIGGPAGGMALLFQGPMFGNRFNFEIGSGAGRVQSTTIPVANTWYHIEATADGTNTKIYVNGVLEGTSSQGSGSITDNPGVAIGAMLNGATPPIPGNYYFDGQIDDVRIYDSARTQEQVLRDMNGS
ncbi:MAG TPA: LamG domain-containing protein [Candidatus Fimivivens sp.]|nr:LamG domain-containing protein [Candidatus Fimivivens sp.]